MAILSSSTLLATLSCLHLTIAYMLLVSPLTILKQGLVFTLGVALQLPQISGTVHLPPDIAHPATFTSPLASPGNPALGLTALFLAFLALSDLAALSMREDVYLAYWTAQTPIRLAALFALEAWIYLFKPAPGIVAEGWSKGLITDVAFTWAFVELLVTFWAFSALRDERTEIAKRKVAEDALRER